MTPCIEEATRLPRVAERDLQTFHILAGHPDAPLSAICFHAQQSVEKPLKAILTSHSVAYPRTHNLEELARMVAEQAVSLPVPGRELRRLNPFAVEFRYDNEVVALITREEAGRYEDLVLRWAEELVSHAST